MVSIELYVIIGSLMLSIWYNLLYDDRQEIKAVMIKKVLVLFDKVEEREGKSER